MASLHCYYSDKVNPNPNWKKCIKNPRIIKFINN